MFDTRQQNVQYGWQSGPRNSDMIELPMPAVRRQTTGGGPGCYGCMNWHTFGIILSLLAASSLALGVADVVVTYKTYMDAMNCKNFQSPVQCQTNNLVFTWVAVGIWGSLPVFIFGILAIYKGSRPMQQVNYFDFLAYLCAFIFTPAIVVLSAIEVYRGSGVYYWPAVNQSDDLVKAIIPIVISGLGLVEFIMCLTGMFYLCCNQASSMMYGGGAMGQPVMRPTTSPYIAQATYDRAYNTQPIQKAVASSFYAAQAPPRCNSTYNQFNTGPMACKQCSPNPAYNYFRS
jgi:hypothetical protein